MGEAFTALGINLPQLIAQVANFIVLLLILRFTLYKPVLRMLDQRRERIAEGLGAAEQARAEASDAQERIQDQLDEARGQGQEIVANAQQVAARIQDDARQQAERGREAGGGARDMAATAGQVGPPIRDDPRQQAERDREAAAERSLQEIQLERDRAIADLRSEFAEITVTAAERVIRESLDDDAHQRIIEETLAESDLGERS